jgi:hypothetical protein
MKPTILEARLDVLHAAVLPLAASLPPGRAEFARRMFCAAVADMEDRHERDAAAEMASAGVVAAVLPTLGQAGAGSQS